MKRRDFIKYAACGLTAVVVGSRLPLPPFFRNMAHAADLTVNLSMEEALVEMVDTEQVFHWLFQLGGADLPSFPGPVIIAFTGEEVTINVTNNLDEVHEFAIVGGPKSDILISTGLIGPGETKEVTFTAPDGGTYMYLDPLNAPVNRVLGLHGAFVVLPQEAQQTPQQQGDVPFLVFPDNAPSPYTRPTRRVQQLFNDLGNPDFFPGDSWIPVRPGNVEPNHGIAESAGGALEPFLFRSRIWVVHQVDPKFNEMAESGFPIAPEDIQQNFLPEYFLINGKSGAFSSHDDATVVEGFIGEPHVVRILHTGLAAPSMHQHANHPYVLAVNNVVLESAFQVDTMTLVSVESDAAGLPLPNTTGASGLLEPDFTTPGFFLKGGSRVDWLTPLIRPPDIPGDPDTPLRELLAEELALVLGDVPQSPLKYPMHDHMEQSQTARGGNYPQGDVTDIVFLGDVDKVPFPVRGLPANRGRGQGQGANRGRNPDHPGQGLSLGHTKDKKETKEPGHSH